MNISIMMSTGCQNLGDELILKNEIFLLKQKYGNNTNFFVFSYDLENIFFFDSKIKYFEYFPIGAKNIKNIFRNFKNYYNFIKIIKKSDKVIIGGGGIMFDNEVGNFSNPLNLWLFRSQVIRFFKKDLIFWGISIDIKNKNNLTKIKKIFSKAKEIYVRDKSSFELLESLGIKSEIILDSVFYDNSQIGLENYKKNFLVKKVEVKDFSVKDLENTDFNGKTVGLALRSSYLNDENNLILEIINYIILNGGKVILLPHSFHKVDNKANDLIFLNQFIKPGIKITSNMQETYEIYKQKKIDFCLSMRLHSMILCQVYGILFIGIKYAKKGDLM
ncbi:MAG: polysaccharide pyruvyl transferase family protein [Candidatus Gracilibacteria bacterium]|nr:polysaccharide pyruvyl transferase family protein [Candidatus Gracilibacteria bacterium]